MPIYSLDTNDFADNSYSLFGIKTSLEDYRLAFFLNQALQTQFVRAEKNIEFELYNEQHSYSMFRFENDYCKNDWFLIANKQMQTNAKSQIENLFSKTDFNFESINYLIPEQKSFEYFLKITGETTNVYKQELTKKIASIPLVDVVFELKPADLKSSDFLIF